MNRAPVPLAMIRHGPTSWNAEKRIQGRIDTPLSADGRERVATWRVPSELAAYRWVVSPRRRARETAELLGLTPTVEPLLAEMNWGEWEGQRLPDLRARYGAEMAANEARGLDFRPPGGESPRDVQGRVAQWLAGVAKAGIATGAVAHAGVIRALYCLASGWDMTGKPPVKLRDGCVQLFTVDAEGRPQVDRLNLPMREG